MSDVFPVKTGEFVDFIQQFVKGATEAADEYNFSPEEIAAMQQEFSDIETAEQDLYEQRSKTQVSKARRDALIKTARKNYRRRIKLARAAENTTEATLARLGLKPLDDTPTTLKTPDDAPVLQVLNDSRMWHKLKFWEAGSARQRRKPAGVIGAEVWRRIIGVDEKPVLVGLATSSPHIIKYQSEHIGKQVEYTIAWLTRRGERGVMSQRVSATVTG